MYSAAGLSLVAALAHVWTMPGHLAEWWGYGSFFLVVALAQGLYGLGLLRRPARALLIFVAVGDFGIVSLYTVTRIVGVSFFGPHAGEVEGVGALGLAATAAELALVALGSTGVRGTSISPGSTPLSF